MFDTVIWFPLSRRPRVVQIGLRCRSRGYFRSLKPVICRTLKHKQFITVTFSKQVIPVVGLVNCYCWNSNSSRMLKEAKNELRTRVCNGTGAFSPEKDADMGSKPTRPR